MMQELMLNAIRAPGLTISRCQSVEKKDSSPFGTLVRNMLNTREGEKTNMQTGQRRADSFPANKAQILTTQGVIREQGNTC